MSINFNEKYMYKPGLYNINNTYIWISKIYVSNFDWIVKVNFNSIRHCYKM